MDQWAARAIAMSPPSEVVPKRRRRLGTIALVAIVAAGAGAILGVGASQVVDRTNTQAACVGTDVVRTALPSVVTVETSSSAGGGNGSGQVIRPDGYVLTNYHVVSAAAGAANGAVAVRYSDGARSSAAIAGLDPTTDLAVIKRPTARRVGRSSRSDHRRACGSVSRSSRLGRHWVSRAP